MHIVIYSLTNTHTYINTHTHTHSYTHTFILSCQRTQLTQHVSSPTHHNNFTDILFSRDVRFITFSIPLPPIPMTVFPSQPIPIVVYKNIPVPSHNNILIPIPSYSYSALGNQSFELVMITENKITSH